jgi:hypothetical protein
MWSTWIAAFAGMTILRYLVAGVIFSEFIDYLLATDNRRRALSIFAQLGHQPLHSKRKSAMMKTSAKKE